MNPTAPPAPHPDKQPAPLPRRVQRAFTAAAAAAAVCLIVGFVNQPALLRGRLARSVDRARGVRRPFEPFTAAMFAVAFTMFAATLAGVFVLAVRRRVKLQPPATTGTVAVVVAVFSATAGWFWYETFAAR